MEQKIRLGATHEVDLKKETKQLTKESKAEAAKRHEAQRIKDSKMVRGKFIFNECPGGVLRFFYHAYKGDPVTHYELYDGEVHDIPLGVARHINKDMAYPEYEYLVGGYFLSEHGDSKKALNTRVKRMIQRASFQSLDFVDVDEINAKPAIYQAEGV